MATNRGEARKGVPSGTELSPLHLNVRESREKLMKLLRYGLPGQEKPGLLDTEGRIRDLSTQIADVSGSVLTPEGLAALQKIDPSTLPTVNGNPRLGACVGSVGKFICVGLNYADHAAEAGMDIPKEPIIFSKWTSAICGPNDDIEIPHQAYKTDWEVELGVVIGKPGRYIAETHAMEHVAGYCVINDISEREWQLERGGSWDKGKGFDTFGPIGPWLVTADEIADPHNLNLWLEVDGQRYQNGNTRTLVFGIPALIAYLSRCMSLQPGDVISTGTPPGVGLGVQPDPVFLRPGQQMRLGIDGLGEQNQRTVAARLNEPKSSAS